MKLSEQQRELLERALDCASTTIITGPESHVKFAETLALIAKAVSVVREAPGRRLRSDFDAKRQDKRQMGFGISATLTPEYFAAQDAKNRAAAHALDRLSFPDEA